MSPVQFQTNRGTVFSECRKYRFTLWRPFNEAVELFTVGPQKIPSELERHCYFVNFICLNPSTADETTNDPTVSRCINLARSWGFGGFCMTNVFALRSTKPPVKEFKNGKAIGEGNLEWILAVADSAAVIVCAWGDHAAHLGRAQHVSDCLAQRYARKLHVLATNAGTPLINLSGNPTHPLYQRKDSTFAPWRGLQE